MFLQVVYCNNIAISYGRNLQFEGPNPIRGKGESVGCQRWCYSISNGRFVQKNENRNRYRDILKNRYRNRYRLLKKPTKKTKTDTDPALEWVRFEESWYILVLEYKAPVIQLVPILLRLSYSLHQFSLSCFHLTETPF